MVSGLLSPSGLAILALAASSSSAFRVPPPDDTGYTSPVEERAAPLANVYTTCIQPNHVALTFDNGPYIYLRHVVDVLSNSSVPGTFFWSGNNYDCIYNADRVADMRYVVSHGHEIAHETWSKPLLTSLSTSAMKAEFSKITLAIEKITGLTPAFMRPPYGVYDNNVLQVANSLGQSIVIWNYEPGDMLGVSIAEQKKVYSDFIVKKNRRAIFLNNEACYYFLPCRSLRHSLGSTTSISRISPLVGVQKHSVHSAPIRYL